MAVNRELKRKIKSVKNISQITKALQLVSAVKTRKAQLALEGSEAYKHLLEDLFTHLLIDIGEEKINLLLTKRNRQNLAEIKTAVILISPSKGFAGSLLSNLNKKLGELITNREGHKKYEEDEFLVFHSDTIEQENVQKIHFALITIDRKGRGMAAKTHQEVIADFPKMVHPPSFHHTKPIASFILEQFEKGDVDEVFVVYTHFVNSFTQKAVVKQLLPFNFTKVYKSIEDKKVLSPWYSYSKKKEDLFNEIYPEFIETLIYHAVQDAVAAEHSARMLAMKNATDNANDLRKEYTLEYNQKRQAAITQEIAEITAASDTV